MRNKKYDIGNTPITLFQKPIELASYAEDPVDIIWENSDESNITSKKDKCFK